MTKGNIFIDKEGVNVSNIQVPNRNSVLTDFYEMRERARKNGDSFFYVNSKELEDFYEKAKLFAQKHHILFHPMVAAENINK